MSSASVRAFEDFVNPWIGGADDDEMCERYCEFDSNDAKAVIGVIRSDLLPGYRQFDDKKKRLIKAALGDAAGASEYEQGRLWDALLPPFDLPEQKAMLFEWMSVALEICDSENER